MTSSDARTAPAGCSNHIVNPSALEPLFKPYEEPCRYRVKADKEGDPAKIINNRRPSNIPIADNLRLFVKRWREGDYPGASDTTREILHYWFGEEHLLETAAGERIPFQYYFCQREAIETFIYLYEVRGLRTLSSITAEFLDKNAYSENNEAAYNAALGVHPEDDRWSKYAFKMATGSGKTKVMSMAIVWSYFHSLWEEGSSLAQDFLVIAPNITVFERLKEDFGDGKIFETDPLIPEAWKGDWNVSVVLQDEASGAATGGRIYLTNIHRLYDTSKRKNKNQVETHDWLGPAVSKARALDTGEALRERVTSHRRMMVLNDEAHHLWDPDSAWNDAIEYVHQTIQERTGGGIVSQLDFSATPKDNHGRIFQHVICDTPLGEAVDGGIVKIPVIGRGEGLVEHPSANAAEKYQQHLMIGYKRWQLSKEEWEKSGKKPLLFIMAEDTVAADQIAQILDTDPLYSDLNKRTINLHTRLKGKIVWEGGKKKGIPVFKPNETGAITEEDLRELRKLSRELDLGTSPYSCIVSVLMLREGWDVRNVTTIVPLRPYTAKAQILPEQTLGRGLRRMTYPGGPSEILTVVEHPVFVSLYEEELGKEGVYPTVVDVDKVPTITVSIFPDGEHKDLTELDMVIPAISPAYTRIPKIDGLTVEDVKARFSSLTPLKLREESSAGEVHYEGRTLVTNEIVEQMTIKMPLLESGVGAISFYRSELEHIAGLHGLHPTLAPLLEIFLTEMLFGERVSLFDQRLINRLGNTDVREHVRAVFVPLLLSKSTVKLEERALGTSKSVVQWRPYQASHSEKHPAIEAPNTAFNLVPCSNAFEVDMARFLARAPDVAAFCKNAGAEAVRIDYQNHTGRLAHYTPDFLIRKTNGDYVMLETKGRVDIDVPLKIRAAVAWCEAASGSGIRWDYLYVPEDVFGKADDNHLDALFPLCEPATQNLIRERIEAPLSLEKGNLERLTVDEFILEKDLDRLPPKPRKCVQESIALFNFLEKKDGVSYAPVFTPLLGAIDDAAKTFVMATLKPSVPDDPQRRQMFFEPDLTVLRPKDESFHRRQAINLRKTLVENDGFMPMGLLKWCLEYAKNPKVPPGGVFIAVKTRFEDLAKTELLDTVGKIYSFRNEYIAHQEKDLDDKDEAKQVLKDWIKGLDLILGAEPTAQS